MSDQQAMENHTLIILSVTTKGTAVDGTINSVSDQQAMENFTLTIPSATSKGIVIRLICT